MGDYTTAHCFLLLGNPTTNIKYINGATMADDLAKYEALAGAVENIDFDGALFQKCAKAITELVAMVRGARDLTWFWQIVDCNGLADVCSDERGALAELARAHRELAELKRKMNE